MRTTTARGGAPSAPRGGAIAVASMPSPAQPDPFPLRHSCRSTAGFVDRHAATRDRDFNSGGRGAGVEMMMARQGILHGQETTWRRFGESMVADTSVEGKPRRSRSCQTPTVPRWPHVITPQIRIIVQPFRNAWITPNASWWRVCCARPSRRPSTGEDAPDALSGAPRRSRVQGFSGGIK